MKRFFESMRFQLTAVLIIFVVLNIAFITAVVLKNVQLNTIEIESERLSVISSQVSERFNKMYSGEYISRNYAEMKESEKRLYINLFLKPVFEDYFSTFVANFPELEFGYYIPSVNPSIVYKGNSAYRLDKKVTLVSAIKTIDNETGYVFVDEPYSVIIKPIEEMRENINRITLYSMLALVFVVFLIISFFTFKIILIRRGLKKLESDLDFRFPKYGGEIGDIAVSVNSMATNLKKSIDEMQRTEFLRNLGLFTAGVVHEVRNPLTSIKGFAQILTKKLQGSDEERYVKPILTETERLERVVNDLLRYGKPTELKKTHVNLRAFFDHIIELAKQYANNTDILFVNNCTDVEINADDKKLEELFLNLFINGVQAMGKSGNIKVACEEESGFVHISVTDTGIGLTEEEIKNLFIPFYTTKPEGTGLGLAIVDRVVNEHSGKIEVVSKKGEGTKFLVTLPRGE